MSAALAEMELIVNDKPQFDNDTVVENLNVQEDDLEDFFPEFDDIWNDVEIPQSIWDEPFLIY